MNEDPISAVVHVVSQRFDPEFVQRFSGSEDARIQSITDRVVAGLRHEPGHSHPIDVYLAAIAAAKAQGLPVFATDDDGTEYLADPLWNAAWRAAFAAAIAYAYPERLSDVEARLLVEDWEKAVR